MKKPNIRLTTECVQCLIRRQARAVEDYDEQQQMEYLKEVMKIIYEGTPEETAPVLVERINQMRTKMLGKSESFDEEKHKYNKLMQKEEQRLEDRLEQEENPLKSALLMARAGNYIDFGALQTVNDETLYELIENSLQEAIDEDVYEHFERDLGQSQKLVYLTDNCGEVILDKLLIKQIKKRYQHLEITVIVRGKPVLNDVTMTEAEKVGLTSLTKVIDNGNGIGGTWPPAMSDSARKVFDEADIVIAKGQGNFETLHGCGRNIYYAFLCKCSLFTKKFGLERLSGVFIHDSMVDKNNREEEIR